MIDRAVALEAGLCSSSRLFWDFHANNAQLGEQLAERFGIEHVFVDIPNPV